MALKNLLSALQAQCNNSCDSKVKKKKVTHFKISQICTQKVYFPQKLLAHFALLKSVSAIKTNPPCCPVRERSNSTIHILIHISYIIGFHIFVTGNQFASFEQFYKFPHKSV